MSAKKQLFKGRPDFPNNEPTPLTAGVSTNDTDEVYCIDTGGITATFGAGMQQISDAGVKSASAWASKTFNGRLYGRWTNITADVQLAVYFVDVANSEE